MNLLVRDKRFYKKVLVIALPVILQSVISIGINMMDTIMLGSFGEKQLSASSLANQFISIFHILCLGIGGGAAVLTSQFWGHHDIPGMRKVITIMYRFVIVTAILFTTISLLFPGVVMSLYTNEQPIIDYGMKYLRIMSIQFICLGMTLTSTIILRTTSSVRIPLFSSICAFFINVFFNYVFIFGKFGAPRLEIAGAAIGTVIARIFELCFVVGYFLFAEKKIAYRIKYIFMPCKDMMQEYFKFSMPVIISDFLLAMGNTMVTIVIGHIGSAFVSANAITTVVVQVSTIFVSGLYSSSGVIVGNTLGEKREKDAFLQGSTFIILSTAVGLFAALVIQILRYPIIGFYNIQDETVEIAHQLMNAVSFIVVFQMLEGVLTKGVLRGGGDTKFLMIADILFLWILSVPLGCLAAFVFHFPPFWIYFFLKIDLIVKVLWCSKRFISKKWIHIVE